MHLDSWHIAISSTPQGNICPKQLVLGAKASQGMFDEILYRIFGVYLYCMIQSDNLLIGCRNMATYNKTLAAVLKKAEDFSTTFNREKCEF